MVDDPDVIPHIIRIGIQVKVLVIIFQAFIKAMQPVVEITQVIQD